MRPAKTKRHKRIFAWAAVATSFAIALSVGNTQGRLIDWASAELIYTPQTSEGYNSNCLTADGQNIMLSDWTAEETQRTLEILVNRPEPILTEPTQTDPSDAEIDPAEPTETLPESTEDTLESTDPTNVTEPSESATDPSVDEEIPSDAALKPAEPQPTEETWPQDEVTVTLDDATAQHLQCVTLVDEQQILLTMERLTDAPGLAKPMKMTILVQWQGLQGTIVFDMLPYGDLEPLTEEETTIPEREIDTTLEPVKMWDTLDPENPVMGVKLNLEIGSDFILELFLGSTPLHKVRWSLDGQTYAMLYDSASLSFSYPYMDGWDGTVFLDFSQALEPEQRPTVAVATTGHNRQECTPVYQSIPQPAQCVLKAADMPGIVEISTRWGAAALSVQTIERLTMDEEGNLTYTQDASMEATVVPTGIQMQPAQADLLPQPGSYRVQVQWIWNDICIEEQIIYFFINTN